MIHADTINQYYEKSKVQNPTLCNRLTRSDDIKWLEKGHRIDKDLAKFWGKQNYLTPAHLVTSEISGMEEAFVKGDLSDALNYTYTAIAQLLRVVDIIEGNEKLASDEKAETKKESQS